MSGGAFQFLDAVDAQPSAFGECLLCEASRKTVLPKQLGEGRARGGRCRRLLSLKHATRRSTRRQVPVCMANSEPPAIE
jgi:hypothetical protein